jgi:hypothetical protein
VSYSGQREWGARDGAAVAIGNLTAGLDGKGQVRSRRASEKHIRPDHPGMLQTPDDRTIASKLAIVTAHTRSSRYARLNPKITKATLTARSAVSALNRLEAWPRSVTDPGTPHGERSTVGSLVSSRCGAFPPVDGFCVGGHAVEEVGDELGMSAAASGEAELPEFCGGTVVVVDRLIRGVGAGLAGTAEKFGQLRFVAGAHAFARGAARLGWP